MKISSLLLLLLLVSGCATIINSPNQDIPVSSNPDGAKVKVDNGTTYTTPAKITLSRKMDHTLTFCAEGYEEENVKVIHVMSGAVAGNLLAGGLIGWGVDAVTGSQYRLVPESVQITLKPKTTKNDFEYKIPEEKPHLLGNGYELKMTNEPSAKGGLCA